MSARNGGKSRRGSGKRTGNKSAANSVRCKDSRKARAITRRDQSRHVCKRFRRKIKAA